MKSIAFIFFLTLPLYVQAKLYVVVVGVSEYGQSCNNLRHCHEDAKEMYKLLKKHTTENRIILLTNHQANHDNIVYNTKQLFQKAEKDDIVIFYFAGHGIENNFLAYDKLLNFSTLKKLFQETKASRKLIFADACYVGTLRNQDSRKKQGLGNNVLLFLSSRHGQISKESHILGSGIFTHYLIAGLRGEADENKDKFITIRELYNYVYPRVKKRLDNEQTAVLWGKYKKNMIILDLYNK